MALIDREKITELKTAAEVKEIASGAAFDIEMMSIAASINNAANTGELSCAYTNKMSTEARAKLVSNGYRITQVNDFDSAIRISWEAPLNETSVEEGSETTDEPANS